MKYNFLGGVPINKKNRIMNYTGTLGTTNEVECMLGFLRLGYNCSIPYGNLAKYDFIVDINDNLYRIQCKHSSCIGPKEDPDGFTFSTVRTNTRNRTKKNIVTRYKEEEVDFFATCFNGKIYIFPVSECLGKAKVIRLKPPKHKIDEKYYTKAEDYELDKKFMPSVEFKNSEKQFKKLYEETNKVQHHCPICGKVVTKKGNHCVDCTNKLKRKVERPDKDTLEKLIKTESFLAIGRRYKVNDNTVRKWCKSYGLPSTKKEINKLTPLS